MPFNGHANITLGALIEALAAENPDKVVRFGFDHPHSYRGYYEDLAFSPAGTTTVGAMLTAARGALGETFEGWKGGDFTMNADSDCWLAEIGCTGEELTTRLLAYMLADEVVS